MRKKFREEVREYCNTLDLFDDIRKELIRNYSDLNLILQLDNKIRETEKKLSELCAQMVEIDTCSCTINGKSVCSSPLCAGQYNEMYKVNGHKV